MKYELYGVGNPLMDLLFEVSEEEFSKFGLEKGKVAIVSAEDLEKYKSLLDGKKPQFAPGGSTSNAISIFTLLGGKGFFSGKVGSNSTMYEEAMHQIGVATNLIKGPGLTGTALTLITPDSERTFAVYLGEALNLKKEEIDMDSLAQSSAVFVGGHEIEDPVLRDVTLHVMNHAKKNNSIICIDVADPGIIVREKDLVLNIIREYGTIVFANEEEAFALTGKKPEEAVEELAKHCDVAVVKLGKKGALIKDKQNYVRIKGVVVEAIDTTGAGDAFAGAFLYAYLKNKDIEVAGNLATFVAAMVVSKIGARIALHTEE